MNDQKQINMIYDEFKDHKIIHHEIMGSDLGRLEYLRWQKPGTFNYLVDYVVKGGVLFVSGDLGAATYTWYENISLEWISGCNLGYFHGKCEASELGRSTKNYEWSKEEAKKNIFDHFKSSCDCKGYKKFKEEGVPLDSSEELIAWCHYNDPIDILNDDDWWEWFPECGDVVPLRTKSHLIGLKMVFDKFEIPVEK